MKKILIILSLVLSVNAFAAFGGSRGGGFSGRSSFGGGRASASRVTISRPVSRPTTVTHTTVVHNNSGGGGNGFFTGMLVGNMMNHNQPVVVAGGVQQPLYADPGNVVVQESHGFFYYFLWTMAILVLIALCITVFV